MLKRFRLSGSSLLLIGICLLVIIAVLLLNIVNSRNLVSLKKSIDTLSKTNSTVEILRNTNEELLIAENQYRIFLSGGDSSYKNKFLQHIKNTIANLHSIENSDDSLRVANILSGLNKKMQLANAIEQLNNLSDSITLNVNNVNVLNIYKKPLRIQKIKTNILAKYFTQQTDTVKAIKQKKTFFKKLGALFSNKDDTKYALVKGDTLTNAALDSSKTELATVLNNLSTDIQSFYQGVINREFAIRQRLNSNERLLAETNLSIISNISLATKSVIKREEAEDIIRNKGAVVNAINAQQSIQNISWASFAIIFLIIVLMIFNISKTLRYEREMIEAKERAEKLAITKARFLHNMSHEIRSPLTSILGFAEQVEKDEQNEEKKKFLQAIHTSSTHLMQTVNDILDYSKLDAGKMLLSKVPFNINNSIAEVIFALKIVAEKKQIQLAFNSQIKKELIVNGDDLRLKQILFNIIGNAIKFTEKGTVTVTASTFKKDDASIDLHVEIMDTGIGIPNNQINLIFEEFAQASSNPASGKRSIRGTGLGLPICKMLIEMQGGTITVESEINKGSLFTFNIPYSVSVENTNIENNALQQSDKMVNHFYPGKKALVVEDNEMNIMLLKLLLNKFHLNFDVAKDGDTALELFQNNSYDLVLTDINIPGLTGDKLAKEIRNNHDINKAKVPIVALTASVVNEDFEYYSATGINDILLKPFKEVELQNMLSKYLS